MRKLLALALVTLMAVSVLTFACAEETETGWQNILLLGGDSRGNSGYDRSDSMIIISINRDEARVKMTSILRDTWVNFPGYSNPGKINAATVYGGPKLAVATVNDVFDMDIEDYVIINMNQLTKIVDLLGGVEVEITSAEAVKLGLPAGVVHMDGEVALAYCRIRSIDSDADRVLRQQNMLIAMADKAQNMEVQELSALVNDIADIVKTSLDDQEMEDLAMAFMVMEPDEVEQFRIPADGTFRSGLYDGVWMITPNFELNIELLHEFIYED